MNLLLDAPFESGPSRGVGHCCCDSMLTQRALDKIPRRGAVFGREVVSLKGNVRGASAFVSASGTQGGVPERLSSGSRASMADEEGADDCSPEGSVRYSRHRSEYVTSRLRLIRKIVLSV